jgi:hypothetical protein
MSLLEKIDTTLRNNPYIIVVDSLRSIDVDGHHRGGREVFEYAVAPRIGMYNRDSLQDLMLKLIPGERPFFVQDFKENGDIFDCGYLMFGESAGNERISIAFPSSESVKMKTNVHLYDGSTNIEESNGTTTITGNHEIGRTIELHLYPNEDIARDVLKEGVYGYRISKKRFIPYLPSPEPQKKKFLEKILG